jgi:hypothetical protein
VATGHEPAGAGVPFDMSRARAVHFLVTDRGRRRAGAGDVGDARNLAIYAGAGRKP